MAVGAFKTKYTGEQIETLLDKISTQSEQKLTSTQYPYTINSSLFETDDIKVTSSGNSINLFTLLLQKTKTGSWWSTSAHITFYFKKEAVIPKKFVCDCTSLSSNNSNYPTRDIMIDYYINNEWIQKANINHGCASNIGILSVELPKEPTQYIRIRCTNDVSTIGEFKNMYIEFE